MWIERGEASDDERLMLSCFGYVRPDAYLELDMRKSGTCGVSAGVRWARGGDGRVRGSNGGAALISWQLFAMSLESGEGLV